MIVTTIKQTEDGELIGINMRHEADEKNKVGLNNSEENIVEQSALALKYLNCKEELREAKRQLESSIRLNEIKDPESKRKVMNALVNAGYIIVEQVEDEDGFFEGEADGTV